MCRKDSGIMVNGVPWEVPRQKKILGLATPRVLTLGVPYGLHSPWYPLGFSTHCPIDSTFCWIILWSFVKISSEHFHSQTRSAGELTFSEKVHLPPPAIVYLSNVTCHMSIHKYKTFYRCQWSTQRPAFRTSRLIDIFNFPPFGHRGQPGILNITTAVRGTEWQAGHLPIMLFILNQGVSLSLNQSRNAVITKSGGVTFTKSQHDVFGLNFQLENWVDNFQIQLTFLGWLH